MNTPLIQSNKGFTLVELLGVFVILILLASVAISEIENAREVGRSAAMTRQLQVVNSALADYLASGGTIEDLRASVNPTTLWITGDAVLDRLSQPITMPGGAVVGPFLPAGVEKVLRRAGVWYRLGFAFSGIQYDFYPDPNTSVWGTVPVSGFTFVIPYQNLSASKSEALNP